MTAAVEISVDAAVVSPDLDSAFSYLRNGSKDFLSRQCWLQKGFGKISIHHSMDG